MCAAHSSGTSTSSPCGSRCARTQRRGCVEVGLRVRDELARVDRRGRVERHGLRERRRPEEDLDALPERAGLRRGLVDAVAHAVAQPPAREERGDGVDRDARAVEARDRELDELRARALEQRAVGRDGVVRAHRSAKGTGAAWERVASMPSMSFSASSRPAFAACSNGVQVWVKSRVANSSR